VNSPSRKIGKLYIGEDVTRIQADTIAIVSRRWRPPCFDCLILQWIADRSKSEQNAGQILHEKA
jgi:hypothetical protein